MSAINTAFGHAHATAVSGTGSDFVDFSGHLKLPHNASSPQTIPNLSTTSQSDGGAAYHNNMMLFSPALGGALLPGGGAYSFDAHSAQKEGLLNAHANPHAESDAVHYGPSASAPPRHTSRSRRGLEAFPAPVKPRVATLRWDRESTFVYQVEAHGCVVSRREDTLFVNGTKLLNVVGMTRGRRDGILKTERVREVVKVGPMCLKGVWIPFERAVEIARNEGVDGLLYPLFVPNLHKFYVEKGLQLRNGGAGEDGSEW